MHAVGGYLSKLTFKAILTVVTTLPASLLHMGCHHQLCSLINMHEMRDSCISVDFCQQIVNTVRELHVLQNKSQTLCTNNLNLERAIIFIIWNMFYFNHTIAISK